MHAAQGKRIMQRMTLGEAAARLGVHPSTLRRWSDTGHVPSSRTKGGHRRFERQVIERLAADELLTEEPPAPNGSPHRVEQWEGLLTRERRVELRQLGQRLLGLLLQYLTRGGESQRHLAESRLVGRSYGEQSAHARLAMLEMVEAFVYFRAHFTEVALKGRSDLPDGAAGEALRPRIDRFMNEVLLGAIEGYGVD